VPAGTCARVTGGIGTIAAAGTAVVLGLLIALTLILLALREYEPLRRPRTPLEPPPVSDPDLLSIVPVHGNQE
jgi:hypothetical protein